MRQPSGEMRGVNYDHTILGWRGALALPPRMSDKRGAADGPGHGTCRKA
jgi:hypothetical protein